MIHYLFCARWAVGIQNRARYGTQQPGHIMDGVGLPSRLLECVFGVQGLHLGMSPILGLPTMQRARLLYLLGIGRAAY